MKRSLGQRVRALFARSPESEEFFEDLEDLLVESDLGAHLTMEIVDGIRRSGRYRTREDLIAALGDRLRDQLVTADLRLERQRLNLLLVMGVNGVGKTTNLAKLACHYRDTWGTERVTLAAGDTFRAAAVEQLALHAGRLGVRVVKQSTGADAAAVIFDALDSAQRRGPGIVLADSAGRMHTRGDLVRELGKIDGVIRRKGGEDLVYRRLLVIDATTGQNALRQAELFHEAVGVDAVLLAKYDSSARGGILLPLKRQLGIDCAWVGTGEGYGDIRPFDAVRYVDDLLAP